MWYSILIPFSAITFSAVSTTTSLTNFNSRFSPTRGIMISGTTSNPFSCFTSIAASITALVCIAAISGYVTASLHPLCPIIGLNSCKESHVS